MTIITTMVAYILNDSDLSVTGPDGGRPPHPDCFFCSLVVSGRDHILALFTFVLL